MVINVTVDGQEMRIDSPDLFHAPNSQRFVKFVFGLSDDWDGLTVFAQFVQGNNAYNVYLDSNKAVYLPNEIKSGGCWLLLYGTGGSNVIGTTHALKLRIDENHFVADGQSTIVTQSLYEQLIIAINNFKTETNATINNYKNSTDAEISSFETYITNLFSSPLTAVHLSDMTDHNKIYVYAGSESGMQYGYWYYWNTTTSQWTAGLPYQAGSLRNEEDLINDRIPNTAQTCEFDSYGKVTKILHKRGSSTIRSDIFTYTDTTVTEVRTLNTGEILTIVRDMSTGAETVTKSA